MKYIRYQEKQDIENFILSNGNGAIVEKMQLRVSKLAGECLTPDISKEWNDLNVSLLKALHHIDNLEKLSNRTVGQPG